jgi:uncharacterized integral membrane protein
MRREEQNQPAGGRGSPHEPVSGSDSAAAAGDAAQVRADQEHLRALQKERQARVAKAVVTLGLAVILIIFILSNSAATRVSFVFFHRKPPLIWVMFACAVLGGIVGFLIGRPGKQVRVRRRPRQEEKS